MKLASATCSPESRSIRNRSLMWALPMSAPPESSWSVVSRVRPTTCSGSEAIVSPSSTDWKKAGARTLNQCFERHLSLTVRAKGAFLVDASLSAIARAAATRVRYLRLPGTNLDPRRPRDAPGRPGPATAGGRRNLDEDPPHGPGLGTDPEQRGGRLALGRRAGKLHMAYLGPRRRVLRLGPRWPHRSADRHPRHRRAAEGRRGPGRGADGAPPPGDTDPPGG